MNTVKFNAGDTKVILHRGLSKIETENTAAAFVAAGNRNCFGIETDVHVTADGKFILIHDDDTKRVSDINVRVNESNFSDLRKMVLRDLNSPGGKAKRSDLRMPDVGEYLEICRRYEKKCVLELKNHIEARKIAELVNMISKSGYLENMIFISFSEKNLIELRKLLPNHQLQLLVKVYSEKVLSILDEYNFDMDINYLRLGKKITETVKKHGHEVNCWTCDDAKAAEKLSSWGIDYITSNILEPIKKRRFLF